MKTGVSIECACTSIDNALHTLLLLIESMENDDPRLIAGRVKSLYLPSIYHVYESVEQSMGDIERAAQ